VGLLASGCLPAPAQITAVSPAPSSGGVATDAAITVVFGAAMDQRSVEQRLRVVDRRGRGIPGCSIGIAARGGRTGCAFRWRAGRVLRLVHTHPLRVSTTYRVSLGAGLANRAGVPITLAHSWLFVTEGPPTVVGTNPGAGGVLNPIGAPAIGFSRAMRPGAVAAAVTLSPQPVGGVTVLPNRSDPTRFLVEPNRPLVPGRRYTLAVSRAAIDIHGNHLPRGARVTFTAGDPGSATGVVFPAGTTPGRLTEVLAAPPPTQAGDPAGVRLLYGSPSGPQLLAVWPAANGRDLAVEPAGRHLLRLIDLVTGSVTPIPDSAATVAGAWSPDGGRFAYIARGTLRVYTVASGTSATVAGAPAVAGLRGPISWRPDGQLLAAVLAPTGRPSRIVLCSPTVRLLTFLPPAGSPVRSQLDPVWSPDGSGLAFAVAGAAGPHLWWYRPADTADPTTPMGSVAGTPIAFLDPSTILAHGPDGGLIRISAETGSGQTTVGPVAGEGALPAAVSVATREIAYTRLEAGYAQIVLVIDSGADAVRLTDFGPSDPLQAGPPALIGRLA